MAPIHPDATGTVRLLGGFPPSRVQVRGNVDITLTEELAQIAQEIDLRGGPVDVDTSGVTFMDSAALAMLARLAYQHPVRVIDPPKVVRFLLDTTRVVEMVDIIYSVERPAVGA